MGVLRIEVVINSFFFSASWLLCFCQIQFLHPTEVHLSSRSQKAGNKESKYRKCQSRDEGDKSSTWPGRPSPSSQGLQAVAAQTTRVYSGGTSRHAGLVQTNPNKMHVLKMFGNSCVVAEVINWLYVSLQAAPLALQQSCNMRPWSPESSLQKMKMQRNCYRWGTETTKRAALSDRHPSEEQRLHACTHWCELWCDQGSQDMAYWHDWWNQLSGFQRQLILLMSMVDDFWSSLTEGQKTVTGNKHIHIWIYHHHLNRLSFDASFLC